MAVLAEHVEALRSMIAEEIPAGGSELEDTLFTNDRLKLLIEGAGGSLERAAYDAWREKAGKYAGLVSVTEGAASREMTELYSNALEMVKLYSRSSAGPTEGRARVGRIVRR